MQRSHIRKCPNQPLSSYRTQVLYDLRLNNHKMQWRGATRRATASLVIQPDLILIAHFLCLMSSTMAQSD